ncbi:hypothetical protein DTO96_102072 [Ephemeroptericola cinctiostellae]|uniref:Uncharacterized protein n=2 Tax=Ephemeroptericola cinctiostellae TaxID=2268024 RepID=A0A345DD87_9BURK|nr:hypothetical protein DTO96_102072 [Ephemeroptericola cinctiostellae]
MASVDAKFHDLIVEPAIVHLHGQSHGFHLLNTADETKNQAAERLSGFIQTTLNHSDCLFIGYSGSADAFFTEIQKKYTGQNRIIWVGHDSEPNAFVSEFVNKNSNLIHYVGDADADEFLITLAQELNCFPPEILHSPYKHMHSLLESIIPYPRKILDGRDVLKETKEELLIRINEENEKHVQPISSEWLLLQGKYHDVIAQFETSKDEDDVNAVYWSYVMFGSALLDSAKETHDKALYDASFEKYAKAVDIKPDKHAAWHSWGDALFDLAQETHDKALYGASFEKYAKAVDIGPDDHLTWYNWGNALYQLANETHNEALFEASFEKYAKAVDIKPDYHEAWYNWGTALHQLANETHNEALFEASFAKYAKAVEIKPDFHEAWGNWGTALSGFAKETHDQAMFEASFAKYAKAVEIKPDDHEAWYNWGTALSNLAAETHDKVMFEASFEKYAKAVEIKPDDHEAWCNWGNALSDFAEETHDQAMFEASFEKYAKAVEIKPDGHKAWNNWGNALLKLAGLDAGDRRKHLLLKAKDVLEKAEQLNLDDVYNLACCEALLGNFEGCRVKLLHCKDRNTLPTQAHLLADDDLIGVRDLPWFAGLLA